MSGTLDRIEVENFKSYLGRHTIGPFRSFSCVCGPNGSGKSNVMDAICFVLGLSAKHMRGSNLTDLIYNNGTPGSVKEGAADAAETPDTASVSLFYTVGMDDSPEIAGGASPGDTIELSRSISLSGASDFRVEGRTVSARVYKRVLQSIHIDTDSKEFLVFQGDVTSLASRSPVELMDYLEVVAGSAALRKDYEASLSARTKAQDESIFAQRQAKGARMELRTAKTQAKEASRFLGLQEEAGTLRTLLALWRLWQVDEDMGRAEATRQEAERAMKEAEEEEAVLDTQISAGTARVKAAVKALKAAERATEAVREGASGALTLQQEAEAQLATEEQRASQADKAADAHRKRVARLRKEEEEHARQLAALRERLEEGGEEEAGEAAASSSSRRTTPSKTAAAAAAATSSSSSSTGRKSASASKRSPLVQLATAKQRDLYYKLRLEARQLTAAKRARLDSLRREAAALEAEARRLASEAAALDAQQEALRSRVREAEGAVGERQEALRSTVAERREAEARVRGSRREVEAALRRQGGLAEELREVRAELSAAEAARSESRAERGAAETVAALQERFGASVLGRVVDLVTPVRAEHATAVEVGLGRHCEAVVVDTEATARECVQMLREMQAPGFLFLPVTTVRVKPVPAEVDRAAAGGRYRLLRDSIRCDAAVRAAADMACGSTVLADTLESAMELRYTAGVACRVVAVDGTLLTKNGNFSGGARAAMRRAPRAKGAAKALREAVERRDRLLGEHEALRRVTGRTEGAGEGPGAAVQQRLLDLEAPLENLQRAEAGIKADLSTCTARLDALSGQLRTLLEEARDKAAPAEAAASRQSSALEAVAALQAEVQAEEDVVFAPLLKSLGIDSIAQYERGSLAEEETAMRLRRELAGQVASVEAAASRQRQLREAAEADVDAAEARAAEARARAAELRAKVTSASTAAGAAESTRAEAAEAVDEARAAAEEAKAEVGTAKKQRAQAGGRRAEAERSLAAAAAEASRQAFRRHDVLIKARVEGITLPTLDGGDAMDAEALAASSSSSSSSSSAAAAFSASGSGQRGLGGRATVTTSVQQQEAEAATRLDYTELEARLSLGDASEAEVRRRVSTLEEKLVEISTEMEAAAPNLRAGEQEETARRRLREAERRLAECNAEAERAEEAFDDVARERATRFGRCVKHVQRTIDPTFKALTRSTRFPHGGAATMHLFDEHSPFDGGGVNLAATFPGKTMRSLGQLSGGEKTVAALALIFAIHDFRKAPFFVMDEIDAALDSSNVHKVSHYIRQRATHRDAAKRVQCIVVSLKDAFFHRAASLIGVCKDLRAPKLTSRSLTLDLDGFATDQHTQAAMPTPAAPRRLAAAATPLPGSTPSRRAEPGSAGAAPPSTGLTSLAGSRVKASRSKAVARRHAVAAREDDDNEGEEEEEEEEEEEGEEVGEATTAMLEGKSDDEAEASAAAVARKKRGRN